ncbi:hypothetical protein SAMN02745702_00822 [Desulfobaculum bizertense DSM 18034]|uniref:Uncharacterized protein n=1 Tax=Desulfobaculum bizertense DSM 18034 TaxID=1121442 RepID=A0A1T4VR19_9BACT|nr:hypothetical protein SAMN02745702_00822 [Desulfobaculum bizertense DSM 18034]
MGGVRDLVSCSAKDARVGGDSVPAPLQGALPLDPAQGRGPWESRFRSKNTAEWDESYAFLSISRIF